MKRLDSTPRLDYWLDDDYDKVKPVESGWMFFDGDFINLHGSVEDVVSDPKPFKPRPRRRVYESPQEVKKPVKHKPLPSTFTNHYSRGAPGSIKEAWHSFRGVCQEPGRGVRIQEEVRMSYQERLQAGVLALQKFESTAGQVVKVEIGHDNDCGVFDSGPCTCCPDIDLLVGTSVYTIDEDGVPHALTNS